MPNEILFKRKILEPGETLTADHIRQALEQFRADQALSSIDESETNPGDITKIQKGAEMDIRTTIRKLDQNIKGTEGEIKKAERISKSDAEEFISRYADEERAANPQLTKEKAYANALLECPRLGGLAIGHSQEMVRGSY